MTSKEALKKINIKCHPNSNPSPMIDEALDIIEKDLEVLEILKETIKNNVFEVAMLDRSPNGETLLSCDDFGIKLKTEDYYKIRGWLNNDK